MITFNKGLLLLLLVISYYHVVPIIVSVYQVPILLIQNKLHITNYYYYTYYNIIKYDND